MFDWLKFIDVARLLENYQTEEFIRSAISRYYFGFFGTLRWYLINFKSQYHLSLKKSKVHTDVSEILKNSNDSTEFELGRILEKIRRLRNICDYDDDVTVDSLYVSDFLNKSKIDLDNTVDSISYIKNNPSFHYNRGDYKWD